MNLKIALFLLLSLLAWVHADESCIVDPWEEECEDFKLPSTEKDIHSLCSHMPHMPGCTIKNICRDDDYENSQYCVPFGILKELCIDMPGMGGCKNYTSMCTPKNTTTVVKQCKTATLPIPTTMEAAHLITDICTEMPMPQCDSCEGEGMGMKCDMLTVYSDLCISMPEMSQCATWKKYCEQIPDWPLCSSSSPDTPPVMRMYFHLGIKDYVLFEGWVPRTDWAYAGTWIVVFLFTFLFEAAKILRVKLEQRWEREHKRTEESVNLLSETHKELKRPFHIWQDGLRAFMQMLEATWGLLIMLIAMTYNVGLFLGIMAGTFVGVFAFGRFANWTEPKVGCH